MRIIIKKSCESDDVLCPKATLSILAICFTLALIAVNTGCAGVTSAGSNTETPTIVVAVSPANITIQTGSTQQFTATVTGSGNTSVTWSATGGSISSSGLYSASTSTGTFSITATSVADPTKSGTATVILTSAPVPVSVSINPVSASLLTGGTQQFTASVSGATNTSVTWSATGGTISSSGLYTAPASAGTYTVTANSVADSTKSASATVTVSAQAPSIVVSINPSSATLAPSGTQQFTATVTGSNNTSVTWSATGGSVSSSGLFTAPSSAGSFIVKATSVADTTKSASATVTVAVAATQLLSVSPTSLSFGNVLIGNSLTQSVTLTNTGTGSVTISAANFTGGVFSLTGLSLPVTLAAGGTRSATIVFIPGVSGAASGSVSFVSNATNSPATVNLSGTGIVPLQHSVDLAWIGSTSTGVTGYYVYRSTTSGSGYAKINASSPTATTAYTDSTVQSGVTYYYVVTAVDGSGSESAYSNESQAAIPIP